MPVKKKSKSVPPPRSSRPHMPGYGLPKGTEGLLPWSWAEQRLKKSHNYWITTITPATVKTDASPHSMVVWGLWQDGRFIFSTGSKSRKARNLQKNKNCIIANEHAHEAVIVEGVAEIADIAARRKFLPVYEKKYKFDMGSMKDDILSMKEPVFAVRPKIVFGLSEAHFQSKATRWKFE
jgi:hypothetical protein